MCCRSLRAPTSERGRAKVQEVCVACHGETGVSVVARLSASRGPIRRGDLQAAPRLSDRQPRPSADDGPRQGAGRADHSPMSRPIMPASRSAIRTRLRLPTPPPAIVQLVELGDPAAQHSALRVMPSRRRRRTDRDADAGGADAEYIVRQLKLYASGERRNDVYARMRAIAAQLTAARSMASRPIIGRGSGDPYTNAIASVCAVAMAQRDNRGTLMSASGGGLNWSTQHTG